MKYRIEDRLVEMVVIECGQCGTPFGLTKRFLEEHRETGRTFYCPNGHPRAYHETEVDRLKKRLKEREAFWEGQYEFERSQHELTRNTLRTTKGHLTRTRKRVAGGVCPCCNRHFGDLYAHMKTKHPEFADTGA